MSKEESIYIGKPMSDKEWDEYHKRVEDSNNYSYERWDFCRAFFVKYYVRQYKTGLVEKELEKTK